MRSRTSTTELRLLLYCWGGVDDARSNLSRSWGAYARKWESVGPSRRAAAEAETEQKVGEYPIVVISGMTICWIAQWLWWGGYIGVAGDNYCPPRWPLISVIWTVFSGIDEYSLHELLMVC